MINQVIPEYKAKALLCDCARILSSRRLLSESAGSLSIRSGNGLWISPASFHPALLTPDKLLREGTGARFFGRGHIDIFELSHHVRIYKQAPEAGAVFVLSPAYIEPLRLQKSFPELIEPGQVSPDLPLCDQARSQKRLLCGKILVCWGSSILDALSNADRIDFSFHELFYRAGNSSPAEDEEAKKLALIHQVIDSVTKQLMPSNL